MKMKDQKIPELEFLNRMVESEQLNSLKEVSDVVMQVAKKLTQSRDCYVAYLDPENGDSVGISFSHMTGACKMYAEMGEARFKIRKDGTYGGLLGYSLDTGESFYLHDPAAHPAAHGLPPRHQPVHQFLSVAAKYKGKILGQIVLGNPKKNYCRDDLQITDKIADTYAVAIKRLLY
jgi:GAF domain-containing protein